MHSTEFWFALVTQSLLRGAGWLLLVLLTAPFVRRASAAYRASVWQMAFVGLVLLPVLLFAVPPLPVLHGDHASESGVPETAPVSVGALTNGPYPSVVAPPPPTMRSELRRSTPSAARHAVDPPQAASPSSAERARHTTGRSAFLTRDFSRILVPVWGIGAVLLLLRLGIRLIALRRLGRGMPAAPPDIAAEARACADRLGLRRAIALQMAPPDRSLHAPITWGLWRPVIVLPAAYAQESNAHCRAALLHEIAHVRRRDWAWLILAQCLCSLYWCVPFVWMTARILNCETELACDDSVLSAGISAPEYADQILEVVRKMQTEKSIPPLSAMPMARPPLAEARIRAILAPARGRQSTSRALVLLAVLLPTCGIALLSLRATAARESRSAPLVPTPVSAAVSAPSSGEPVSMSAETVPLTIRKVALRSSLRTDRAAPVGEAVPATTIALRGSEPPLMRSSPALPNPPQSIIRWGLPVNGLQAGLRLVAARVAFAPGEPIWQETYLRNHSQEAVSVETIGFYEEQGAPLITDAKGKRVKVLQYFGVGMMFKKSTRVAPGELALVEQVAVAFQAPERGPDRPREVAPGLSSSAEGMPLALSGPGNYALRQEVFPRDAQGKPLKNSLRTGVFPLQIENVPAVVTQKVDYNRIANLATAPIAWGAERSGLQAGLLSLGTKSEFYIGERVRVAVVLRNVSKAPIPFWHQTSFAFLDVPEVADAQSKRRTVTLSSEPEWSGLNAIRMIGLTYDMTFAPSADGPSRLRRSEIAPGQSVLGYYLTGFVLPARWKDGAVTPGRYQLTQPVRVGLKIDEALDTRLETGGLNMTVYDPDEPALVL
jgi:beta-lactamase regulating signal transducer with metallopeptidase domain